MEVFQKADKEAAGVYVFNREKVATFSDSEVRGSIANEEPTIDEEDRWE